MIDVIFRYKQRTVFLLIAVSFFGILGWSFFDLLQEESAKNFSRFDSFDHLNGAATRIVPNLVHYVLFGTNSLNFVTFLSMTSVLKIQKPESILIHSDNEHINGSYWELIQLLAKHENVKIKILFMRQPTHVFGQPLSSIYHTTDVARLIVLMHYGGIYLDSDTLVLQPLNQFLKFEMVVGWPQNENLGTQIIIGHKDARFLKFWLEGYRKYQPRNWYYNAGQYPAELLLEKPQLAHRVDTLLGVHNLIENLYKAKEWKEWKKYFSIHLLARHHRDVSNLNENNIRTYGHTFGQIAFWLLYETEPVLINDEKKHWKI